MPENTPDTPEKVTVAAGDFPVHIPDAGLLLPGHPREVEDSEHVQELRRNGALTVTPAEKPTTSRSSGAKE